MNTSLTIIISPTLTNVNSSNFNMQISKYYSSNFVIRLKVKTSSNCCSDHSLVIFVSTRPKFYICLTIAISASLHCFNESNSYNPNYNMQSFQEAKPRKITA